MSEAAVQPTAFPGRSFIYRKLTPLGARFGDVKGAAVALSFGDERAELARAGKLGIADLCTLARTGFKGPGTADWLKSQQVDVPEDSNRALRQADGALAARLAPGEVLLLGDLEARSDLKTRLEGAWNRAEIPPVKPRGFPVPRQDSHAWFAITGEHAAAMFAKICGIDLRPHKFPDGRIAQTSVARVGAILIRHDLGATLAYYALLDSASAGYFWDCLMDAAAEFEGGPIGLAALRMLAKA